jgi:hypothetical protein
VLSVFGGCIALDEGFVIPFREGVWWLVARCLGIVLYIMTTLKTFALLGWIEWVEMVLFRFFVVYVFCNYLSFEAF